MSIITKEKLVDEKDFILLMEEYKLPMYKTAKAILKNEDDVCDVIQEALISIYKNLNSLKNDKYLKTWIIKITINKCYDLIEKNNVNNRKIIKMQNNIQEENAQEQTELKTDLERALSLIDNDLKIITVLYYYDDISVKEIADILKIPVGTVKSKLSRAREKLYNILEQEEVGKH